MDDVAAGCKVATHHKRIQSINQCHRDSTLAIMSCAADGSQLILHQDISPSVSSFQVYELEFAAHIV